MPLFLPQDYASQQSNWVTMSTRPFPLGSKHEIRHNSCSLQNKCGWFDIPRMSRWVILPWLLQLLSEAPKNYLPERKSCSIVTSLVLGELGPYKFPLGS